MKSTENISALTRTFTIEDKEFYGITSMFPQRVAQLLAEQYVKENYDSLLKNKSLVAEAKKEAQHIIAQHIARHVTDTFDKGLEHKR